MFVSLLSLVFLCDIQVYAEETVNLFFTSDLEAYLEPCG
jgi:hypothetical protein